MRSLLIPLTCCLGLAGGLLSLARAQTTDHVSYIRTSDQAARKAYLARASIWSDPGTVSPKQLLDGPPGRFSLDFDQANSNEGIPCEYSIPGKSLGGKTQKFICKTNDGKSMRVKYFENHRGNREIFSSVSSTRLLWKLGFNSDAVFPVRVNCLDCPKNPWTGTGEQSSRVIMGTMEPHYKGTLILSGHNPEQGWGWGELDDAIKSLPPGSLRARQRMHFDALTLLGVFVQHGDRKPSQQRLVCGGAIDMDAGDVHSVAPSDDKDWHLPVLFEREESVSCEEPVVVVQDVGATWGGAGSATIGSTTKMSLSHWASKPVFRDPPKSDECVGNILVSFTAGVTGESYPLISEAGREFLAKQFDRLTDDHLRAILTAARVEELGKENRWKDPKSGKVYEGIEAWVAVANKKIREIREKRCKAFHTETTRRSE